MPEIESAPQKGLFSKLANGDFGLAKTFVNSLLFGLIFGSVLQLLDSAGSIVVFLLFYTAYMIPLQMGLWNAADKYRGFKIWAVLAKILVVVDIIKLAINWLNLPVLFGYN
ncbi:MAG: hypothetical protein ABL925_19680 [Methylococcales bacterium]